MSCFELRFHSWKLWWDGWRLNDAVVFLTFPIISRLCILYTIMASFIITQFWYKNFLGMQLLIFKAQLNTIIDGGIIMTQQIFKGLSRLSWCSKELEISWLALSIHWNWNFVWGITPSVLWRTSSPKNYRPPWPFIHVMYT